MNTAHIGKETAACLFQSGFNMFVCTSVLRARLRMQMTACDFLLDIGFASVFTSASHSSRHWLRIILTSASCHSSHRLRISSNNPLNPNYLNSAELPNPTYLNSRRNPQTQPTLTSTNTAQTQPTLTPANHPRVTIFVSVCLNVCFNVCFPPN